jgi:glycosyltransferase involved in cell wall biosynthesis
MMKPKVSIILAVYNGEQFLAETVASVRAQTFTDWELLIVDDGSKDASRSLSEGFVSEDSRIRILTHPDGGNHGLSPSRNVAVGQAKAPLIAVIDADDVWAPQKLADQVRLMEAMPEVGMVCGTVNYWSSWRGGQDELRPTAFVINAAVPPPYMTILSYPIGRWHAPTPSDVMIRKTVLDACGGFENSFVGPVMIYEDQALFAKIYLMTSVYISDRVWLKYRQHATSMMESEIGQGHYQIARGYFLNWFYDYIRTHPQGQNPALLAALAEARAVEGSRLLRLIDKVRRRLLNRRV